MTGPEPQRVGLRAADGTELSALRWAAPAGRPGVVIVHGWMSRASNHTDFADRCAERGWAALAVDLRGHGRSSGAPGPGMVDDVLAGVERLAGWGHTSIGLRGSSLGGFLVLHAASRADVAAVAAICPARPVALAGRLGDPWPAALPLEPTMSRDDRVARGFWHATGDDRVPWASTLALAGIAPHPKHLRVELGGSHGSLQHNPDTQEQVLRFLAAHVETAPG